MITLSDFLQTKIVCPVCDNETDSSIFTRKKISASALEVLSLHVNDGVLDDVLKIAEIGMKSLHPDNILSEYKQNEFFGKIQKEILQTMDSAQKGQANFLQQLLSADEADRQKMLEEHLKTQELTRQQYNKEIHEKIEIIRKAEEERTKEYAELNKTLRELQEKLFGTKIGTAGEVVTILDLKKVCPTDEFSETRSSKHGTDIVAAVIEHGQKCGLISISVKYQQKWDSKFITQLAKNMQEDNSRWGILVTKVFPREALNTKMWTTRDSSGKMVFMVKPEYSPMAYYASRQIAIHWKSIEQLLKTKEATQKEEERIKGAIMEWLTGEKFERTMQNITNATEKNKELDDGLLSMQTYLHERIKKLRDCSDGLQDFIEYVKFALKDLKQILHSKKDKSDSLVYKNLISNNVSENMESEK